MYEAIPESVLSQLSAEDLRLLLCGCPHIDVDVVRGITVFEDESRKYQPTILYLYVPTCTQCSHSPKRDEMHILILMIGL